MSLSRPSRRGSGRTNINHLLWSYRVSNPRRSRCSTQSRRRGFATRENEQNVRMVDAHEHGPGVAMRSVSPVLALVLPQWRQKLASSAVLEYACATRRLRRGAPADGALAANNCLPPSAGFYRTPVRRQVLLWGSPKECMWCRDGSAVFQGRGELYPAT
ncbi:hypothetical protein B0H13DRAFT_1969720 [Mycena leptocephala]|nr:hypothetical protein B0H13DRAFT_1969720 [Mycena leptocephala]